MNISQFNPKTGQLQIERYLPHNFLGEKIVLSSLIINSEAVEFAIRHLTIETFYFKNHQELYKAIIFLYNENQIIDIITLTTFLQDNGLIEKVGGLKVLKQLIDQIPNLVYLEEYIKLLQDKFLRRTLIRLGYQIINSSYITNIPLETLLNDIEGQLFNITNGRDNSSLLSSAELLSNVFIELKQKSVQVVLPGLKSGFDNLDAITQGFQKSDLIIVAGRPAMGKTALCLNIANTICKNYKLPVIFFSLEMSKEQLMYRLLANETEISSLSLKSGNINKNDWEKLSLAIKSLSALPIFIDDAPNISIQNIRSKIKKILFEQTQIGLIIIDYLQLMEISKLKTENRVQELSQITRTLKAVAREFNIPIIALSQLSRSVENRIDKRPMLSDLRESGSIEQDADLVLMLYRESYYKKHEINHDNLNLDLAELIVAKHRNGPTGIANLKFDAEYTKFSSYISPV
jgi:replicative DNA helicase